MDKDLKNFVETNFPMAREGYGATEIGAIASAGRLVDNIGCKLVSVPELGYHTSDLPFPRGELWVLTQVIFDCFFFYFLLFIYFFFFFNLKMCVYFFVFFLFLFSSFVDLN